MALYRLREYILGRARPSQNDTKRSMLIKSQRELLKYVHPLTMPLYGYHPSLTSLLPHCVTPHVAHWPRGNTPPPRPGVSSLRFGSRPPGRVYEAGRRISRTSPSRIRICYQVSQGSLGRGPTGYGDGGNLHERACCPAATAGRGRRRWHCLAAGASRTAQPRGRTVHGWWWCHLPGQG